MLQIENGNVVAKPRNEHCQFNIVIRFFFDGQAFN